MISDTVASTVVVASFSPVETLCNCLDSLLIGAPGAEIIVSTCLTEVQVDPLKTIYPSIFFEISQEETEPEKIKLRETRVFRLRAAGVKLAKGNVIAMIEDHCEVDSNWLLNMEKALEQGTVIAGGAIRNGDEQGLFKCALYWAEYAAMMPPFFNTSITYVSAVNSAYKRDLLFSCVDIWRNGFYDNEVHDALIAEGASLTLVGGSTVKTKLPFTRTQAIMHLYSGAIRYGSHRVGKKWHVERIIRLPATLLVPWVLTYIIFRNVRLRRPDQTGKFIMSLPWLLLLLSAWGAGELWGTLRGSNDI